MALDLRELEAALAGLEADLSAGGLEGLMHDAGQVVQSKWRDNIAEAGLVETGQYLESIEVITNKKDERFIQVSVQSDARNDGVPYPAILEFGDSEITATPVGMRAFDKSRRAVVKHVSEVLDRKVKSRAQRATSAKGIK